MVIRFNPSFNSYSASYNSWCTGTLLNIITAQWEGMEDVGSARYEPALLPPCPTIRVLSYRNCQKSTHSISKWISEILRVLRLLFLHLLYELIATIFKWHISSNIVILHHSRFVCCCCHPVTQPKTFREIAGLPPSACRPVRLTQFQRIGDGNNCIIVVSLYFYLPFMISNNCSEKKPELM